MIKTVDIDVAKATLSEIIAELLPNDEVVIVDNQLPVAKLIGTTPFLSQPRQPGLCKGMITLLTEDDEHLKDFAEYMP